MSRTQAQRALKALSDAGHAPLADALGALLAAVATAAADHPDVADALTVVLGDSAGPEGSRGGRRTPRRSEPPFNPFVVFSDTGEEGLRTQLNGCSLEQLKDIIAGHQMDRDKLAMKWKSTERLVGRIIETVTVRAAHGDGFR